MALSQTDLPLYEVYELLSQASGREEEPIETLMERARFMNGRYASFLKGKSLSLAGPSKSLLGQNQGSKIDQADLVVRLNNVVEFMYHQRENLESSFPDFGRKFDVLYLSPGHIKIYLKDPAPLSYAVRRHQIQFIVCANNHPEKHEENVGLIRQLDDILRRIQTEVDFFITPPDAIEFLERKLSHVFGRKRTPTTGLVCIFDLLLHEIRSLSVFGMTFYKNHRNLFRKEFDGEDQFQTHFEKHDPDSELQMTRMIRDWFPERIWTDPTLSELLRAENPR